MVATEQIEVHDPERTGAHTLRRDQYGLALSPQPSQDPLDPLNWRPWMKCMVLVEVSILSFISLMSASLITPAFGPLANFLNHGLVETAYVTSMFIFFVGLSAIFWNPISNVYGRRPIYIMSVAVGLAMSVASGKADSYGSLVVFRCLNGFFGGVPLGLGSATVCDMFFVNERGFYMGIYTVTFITGGHIAPIIGGYIEANLSWRWCFYVPAIVSAVLLVLFILTVPETLYPRAPGSPLRPNRSWMRNMLMLWRAHPTRRLRLIDFCRPFQMLRYPSVLLPTLCYAVSFAYGSILFIISSANLFGSVYQYQPQQTGLLLGVPITVGSLVGETISGGFSDWISERRAVSRGGERKPEDRLLAILPAVFFTPVGIIVEGVCLENMTPWIGAAFGVGLASFGLQITTTVVYTYTAECYKPQAPELGSILNFARQMFSFAMSFYAIPFAQLVGVQNAWIVMALVTVFFFLPLIPLFFKGEGWRKKVGESVIRC